MARRTNNSNEPATLIPIDEVALAVGFSHAPENIWRRLEPADVHLNWRYAHCVTPAKARQLVDQFAEAAREGERVTAERCRADEEKLERENARLRAEAAARAPRRVIHGVETSVPGEPRPDWDAEA
jgi:hypothetical protein